jgi:hypothetical protein
VESPRISLVRGDAPCPCLFLLTCARTSCGTRSGAGRDTCMHAGRFEARIGIARNKHIYLGLFSEEAEAARAYDRAVVRIKGAHASTNFSLGQYSRQVTEHVLKMLQVRLPPLEVHACMHRFRCNGPPLEVHWPAAYVRKMVQVHRPAAFAQLSARARQMLPVAAAQCDAAAATASGRVCPPCPASSVAAHLPEGSDAVGELLRDASGGSLHSSQAPVTREDIFQLEEKKAPPWSVLLAPCLAHACMSARVGTACPLTRMP